MGANVGQCAPPPEFSAHRPGGSGKRDNSAFSEPGGPADRAFWRGWPTSRPLRSPRDAALGARRSRRSLLLRGGGRARGRSGRPDSSLSVPGDASESAFRDPGRPRGGAESSDRRFSSSRRPSDRTFRVRGRRRGFARGRDSSFDAPRRASDRASAGTRATSRRRGWQRFEFPVASARLGSRFSSPRPTSARREWLRFELPGASVCVGSRFSSPRPTWERRERLRFAFSDASVCAGSRSSSPSRSGYCVAERVRGTSKVTGPPGGGKVQRLA